MSTFSMHFLALASLLLFLPETSVDAFQPRNLPRNTDDGGRRPTTTTTPRTTPNSSFHDDDAAADTPDGLSTAGNTQEQPHTTLDLDRARDFASHYGKYTYEEVETMRDGLHADRVKNDAPNDVLFLERYLEDELTSQLQALKEESPEPYLFEYPHEMVSKGPFGGDGIERESNIRKSVDDLFAASLSVTPNEDTRTTTRTTTTTTADAAAVTAVTAAAVAAVEEVEKEGFDLSDLLLREGVMEGLAICIVVAIYSLIYQ